MMNKEQGDRHIPHDYKTWDGMVFPCGSMVKDLPPMQETQRHGFDPSVGKITWRRKWQPTPVFLPGKSHGQRSLVVYSPLGNKESDMTATEDTGVFIDGLAKLRIKHMIEPLLGLYTVKELVFQYEENKTWKVKKKKKRFHF